MRIAPKKVAQRVDDDLVIIDESTGNEVTLSPGELGRLLDAVIYLYPDSAIAQYEARKALGLPRSPP